MSAPPADRGALDAGSIDSATFTAERTWGGEGTTFTCGLCGLRFTHGERVCASCPIHAGCELVRCPNCGYQFPRESKLVRWVTGVLRGGRP